MEYKQCTSKWHVGEEPLPLADFSRDRNRKSGYHTHCKSCRRLARLDWYQHNKKEHREKVKDDYYENHDHNKDVANKRSKRYKEQRGVAWALLMSVKSRAKKRSLDFDLDEVDLIPPSHCPVLGIPLQQVVGPRGPNYPTVDRIHNDKGYTKDNILIISWRANDLKGTATLEELMLLGKFAERYIND